MIFYKLHRSKAKTYNISYTTYRRAIINNSFFKDHAINLILVFNINNDPYLFIYQNPLDNPKKSKSQFVKSKKNPKKRISLD